jgi:hypothetical protein
MTLVTSIGGLLLQYRYAVSRVMLSSSSRPHETASAEGCNNFLAVQQALWRVNALGLFL